MTCKHENGLCGLAGDPVFTCADCGAKVNVPERNALREVERLRGQLKTALQAFFELETLALVDAPKWLNDATRWEGDEYLEPKFQALRERVYAISESARSPHPPIEEKGK